MATFITTIKFTEQGIKAIGDTTKRAASFEATAKKMGLKVTNIYWTLGACDGVLIFEAPDDETATALLLHLGSLGNVQTTTARAFTTAEMDKILAKDERPLNIPSKAENEERIAMHLKDWKLTIQRIVDESNHEQTEARKHKILAEWRAKLGKEPTLLGPHQIDEIVREVRRRLGNASR